MRYNFFSVSYNTIMHFNGLDWRDVSPVGLGFSIDQFPIKDALYLDSTLFLVTQNGNKTLI
jgi:hypothetical protein